MLGKTNAGGGAGLNLKVVGGTAQPASPKENTLWVNTDTEISSYAFSATEPENPVEGMVWIKTSANSTIPIDVDKKNTVMLYPTACKQYVDGAWVVKEANTYQNGEWKTMLPSGYLFYFGKQQYSWQARGWVMNSYVNWVAKAPAITENSNGSVTLTMQYDSTDCSGVYEIAEDVDVTNYNTLILDATLDHIGLYLAVVKRNATYCHENAVAATSLDNSKTLDISALSGLYDIVIIMRVRKSGDEATGKTLVFNSLIAQ